MRMKQGYVAALVAPSAAAIAHAGPSGGSINGKVTYQGTPETPKPIDTSREPIYAKQHATPMTETVVTNALENVLVYVPAGSLDETMPASQPVRIDQKPAHPSGGFSGQPVTGNRQRRQDFSQHPSAAKVKREWNKSQPSGPPLMTDKYEKPEFTKCNTGQLHASEFAGREVHHHGVALSPMVTKRRKSLLVMKRRRFSRLQSEALLGRRD
jgi:hypothetical protein